MATNTQLTGNKLSGMSVLYECVQTIMFIESDPHLRVRPSASYVRVFVRERERESGLNHVCDGNR